MRLIPTINAAMDRREADCGAWPDRLLVLLARRRVHLDDDNRNGRAKKRSALARQAKKMRYPETEPVHSTRQE
jgi:hypothetical protein